MAATMTRPAADAPAPPPRRASPPGWVVLASVVVVVAAIAGIALVAVDRTAALGGTVTAVDGPLTYRSQAATVALDDGRVLIWGGRSTTTDSGSIYDPATDTWEQLPPAPGRPRFSAAAAWTGTEAIIVGGSDASTERFVPLATGIAWNPTTGSWRELPVAPEGLMDARALAFDTGVLVTGGSRVTSDHVPSDLWFDLRDETWTAIPVPGQVLSLTRGNGRVLAAAQTPQASSAGPGWSWSALAFDPIQVRWVPIAPPIDAPWVALAPGADGALSAVTADLEQLRGLVLEDGRWVEAAAIRSSAVATIEPTGYPPVGVWTGDQLVLGGQGGLVAWSPRARTFATLTDPAIRTFGATAVWTGHQVVALSSQSSEGFTWTPPPPDVP